jgi:hypothetical protein
MKQFRQVGFIDHNGGLKIHSSLLIVLRDFVLVRLLRTLCWYRSFICWRV